MLFKHGLGGVALSGAGGGGGGNVYTDNFNRADETLDTNANWTKAADTGGSTDVGVVSNRVTSEISGAIVQRFAFEGGTPTDNQYAEITVTDADTTDSTQHHCGVLNRFTGTQDYYYLEARLVGRWRIWEVSAGTATEIADTNSATDPVGVNDVLRLESNGTTIRALLNDVEVLSVTDSTHTTGKCGVALAQNTNATASGQIGFDDFECGDL